MKRFETATNKIKWTKWNLFFTNSYNFWWQKNILNFFSYFYFSWQLRKFDSLNNGILIYLPLSYCSFMLGPLKNKHRRPMITLCTYDGVRRVSGSRRDPVVSAEDPTAIITSNWKTGLRPSRCEFWATRRNGIFSS